MRQNMILSLKESQDDAPLTLSFRGLAQIEHLNDEDLITYKEQDHPEISVRIRINPHHCILMRKAEHTTVLHLDETLNSYVTIVNEYGKFEIPVTFISLKFEEDRWEIQYITGEGTQQTKFHFLWEVKGEKQA